MTRRCSSDPGPLSSTESVTRQAMSTPTPWPQALITDIDHLDADVLLAARPPGGSTSSPMRSTRGPVTFPAPCRSRAGRMLGCRTTNSSGASRRWASPPRRTW